MPPLYLTGRSWAIWGIGGGFPFVVISFEFIPSCSPPVPGVHFQRFGTCLPVLGGRVGRYASHVCFIVTITPSIVFGWDFLMFGSWLSVMIRALIPSLILCNNAIQNSWPTFVVWGGFALSPNVSAHMHF